MELLEVDQVLAVAREILGCDALDAVVRTDLPALELAVAEQRTAAEAGGLAGAAAGLLRALVRRRPFHGSNRTIAVTAVLQLLALNGCDLELEPVGEIDALLDKIAADPTQTLPLAGLADQLSLRIVPLPPAIGEGEAMFERFSRVARQAVVLAQEEARELGHERIGTEHVLLALLRVDEGVAASVLTGLGITLDDTREQVDRLVGPGEGSPRGHIPFSPRAKKVLELSLREALSLGHNYIGTEHVLLGLVREGKGVAARALVAMGLTLPVVRRAVLAELGTSSSSDTDDQLARMRELADLPSGIEIRIGRRKRLIRELNDLFGENDKLRKEIDRLTGLLREHGIDPAA